MRQTGLLLGVFFTALAILVLEVSLIRIFSVTLWYHLAFMAVSLALFGIGASGVYVYLKQGPGLLEKLPLFSTGFAVSVAVSMVLLLSFPHPIDVSFGSFLTLLTVYAIASIPFFLGGACLSIVLMELSKDISRLYFFDLVGSGLGSLLVILLLGQFTGPDVVLISGIFASVGTFCFSMRDRKMASMALILLLGLAALFAVNAGTGTIHVTFAKGFEESNLLFEQWNAFSRITVLPGVEGLTLGWGLSPNYDAGSVEQLQIIIDSSAGTQMNRFDGNFSEVEHLKYDITALAYYLDKDKVLIIGPGGGRDVLTALMFNSSDVTGVEINPIIVDLVKEDYAEFTGDIYSRPDVDIVVADGRSYIRRAPERYDLIQASLIDTWAATAAGAYTLSENSLYTKEAFVEYFEHLDEDGVLTISRFVFQPPQQTLRVVSLSIEALQEFGVDNSEKHFMIFKTPVVYDENLFVGNVLVKKSEFTDEEIALVSSKAEELGFITIYTPNNQSDAVFSELITASDRQGFYDGYLFDVSPSTDDRPFFFHMLRTKDFLNFFALAPGTEGGQLFNYYAVFVLVSLLGISAVLVVLFIFGPLLLRKRAALDVKGSMPYLIYFACIGLGFILIEIVFMQRFVLFLGHPVFAFAVVLFSMLVFSGLGSLATSRIKSLWPVVAGISVFGLLYYLFLSGMFNVALGLDLSARILLSIITLAPIAFLMGMPLPIGIKRTDSFGHSLVPWVWGINGAASVLGSVFAVFLAINFGFGATLLIGLGFYLLALLTLYRR
jgi:hypothetical protein